MGIFTNHMGILTLLSFSSLVFLINVMHQESGNHQTLKRNQTFFSFSWLKKKLWRTHLPRSRSSLRRYSSSFETRIILNNKKYFVIFTPCFNSICIFGAFYSLELFYFFVTFCCIKPQSVRDWSEGNILWRAWWFWSHNGNEKFGIVALFAVIDIMMVFFFAFFEWSSRRYCYLLSIHFNFDLPD